MSGLTGSIINKSGLIGTVTSGDISNVAIVPPGRSVVQVVNTQLFASYSLTAGGTTLATHHSGGSGTPYKRATEAQMPAATITTRFANSLILIMQYAGNMHTNTLSPYVNQNFERWKNDQNEALVHTGDTYGIYRASAFNGEKNRYLTWMDAPNDPAGTKLQYISVFTCSGGSASIGTGGTGSQMTLMEIKTA